MKLDKCIFLKKYAYAFCICKWNRWFKFCGYIYNNTYYINYIKCPLKGVIIIKD